MKQQPFRPGAARSGRTPRASRRRPTGVWHGGTGGALLAGLLVTCVVLGSLIEAGTPSTASARAFPAAGTPGASGAPAALSVVATLPLAPEAGISVGPPVLDPSTGSVYVPDFAAGSVAVVQGVSLAASVPVPGNPVSAVYDPANGYVYVGSANSSSLSVLDGTTVVAEVPVPLCASTPGQAAVDPANGFVYVPNPCAGSVTVVNGSSVVATVPLAGPSGSPTVLSATFDPGDGLVYVTFPVNGTVYVLNGTAVSRTIAVGGWPNPGAYDPVTGMLYTTLSGTCTVALLRGGSLVSNVTVGGSSCRDGFGGPATFDPANGLVYVSYEGGPPYHAFVAVLNGTHELSDLDVGPHIAGSASFGAFGNGTGFLYQTTAESLSGGLGAGTLTAVGGVLVAATLNLSSEPVGVVFEPTRGYVYLPTYSTPAGPGGASNQSIVVVACSACKTVTFSVRGAPVGTRWDVTALNGTSGFAEAQSSNAMSIDLHLLPGTYRVSTRLPQGATVALTGGDAAYDPSTATVRVGIAPPPPSHVPWSLAGSWLGVPVVGYIGALAAASAASLVWTERAAVRRQGNALSARMEEEIERGDPTFFTGG